ncbi:ABC transporter permease [Pedosphaera parvula]|uniref:Binding-protein-dependent transport systems inner membrane component n=1 Tax=Pedosphaera parvula (strain Ellin514) TaxID=320771 RepID=B9XPR7_PEDPL|nr:ABC transporter permease [Pedosphaera parvula]EEF58190.1 binding-protein-dependent transport systems inner membrane component [Pedosphaera parvula Ellin514]
MLSFIIKRVLHLIPILLGVSLLTFLLMALTPGDYYTQLAQNPQISPEKVAQLRAERHLDKPWYIQYAYWLKGALQGNFGYSVAYKTSASDLIASRLWNTFLLSLCATVLAWCTAIPLGIWAAVKKDSWVDRLCSLIAFVGLSIPDVLLALLALMLAASTGWFPVGGSQSPLYDLMTPGQQFMDRIHHLILPTIVLAAGELAGIMRQMRSNLLDSLRAEFVTTARAKGVPEGWVIYKHVLRNAINPLLTIFGYSLAGLLSGAFIVENIMAWPGLGRLTIEALSAKDYFLVVDSVVMAAGLLVAGNFIADLLLAWSDPRIRLK